MVRAVVARLAGCATHYIPNTDVEDNDENRKVIAFCEKYRHAVEERNVPLLLSMASPRYYEDGGNVDATDDMDFAGLRDYLEGRFKDTRAIRYEIRYRKVNRGRAGQDPGRLHLQRLLQDPRASRAKSGGIPSRTIASSSFQSRLPTRF